MSLTPHYYISVSARRVTFGTKYRVALKHCRGDWNSLDNTIEERLCQTKMSATNYIADIKKRFPQAVTNMLPWRD